MTNSKLEYYQDENSLQEELHTLQRENQKLKLELHTYKEINDHSANSMKKFEPLFHAMLDAVYYFEVNENGIPGPFIEANEIACRKLGYTREELLDMSLFDIDIHEEEELVQTFRNRPDDKPGTMETTHICKDGTQLPVEISTHTIEVKEKKIMIAVCKDLSEKKQSEEMLHHTREKYKRLVECSTNGITVLQDGKWAYANEAALKLFGAKTKEELLGKSIYDMLHPQFADECRRLLQEGGIHEQLTRIWTTLDGREIHTEVVSIPFTFGGRPANQLIIQDVTARKQSERLVIQAEKMNVVGQLAAGIAHEIRNPLTSLKGFVQLFRSGTIPDETFLDIMEAELDRIDLISSEFLSLAQPANTDFSPVDLRDVIQSVLDLLDTEAFKKSISFQTNLHAVHTIVNGAATQLKQVFINLIKNAIEVMNHGGTVTIQIENKDGYIYTSVQDQGTGMTDEQLSRLGEPFFTTKETGTGLGLMVTYSIIDHHNGSIYVQSRQKEGTTFTIKLPVC